MYFVALLLNKKALFWLEFPRTLEFIGLKTKTTCSLCRFDTTCCTLRACGNIPCILHLTLGFPVGFNITAFGFIRFMSIIRVGFNTVALGTINSIVGFNTAALGTINSRPIVVGIEGVVADKSSSFAHK